MYINSYCSISPVGLHHLKSSFQNINKKAFQPTFFCIEPDYTLWMNAIQLRRMSKLIKMSVAVASVCSKYAPTPDGILIGTAYGTLEESETFLQNMIVEQEKLLTPTAFIQSTHNTLGGQIALALKCNAHNMTFVHKGHSFESAVLDAELSLTEENNENILVGGAEILTPTSFEILKRAKVYSSNITAGEGVAFLNFSKNKTQNTIASIPCFEPFYSNDKNEIIKIIKHFIKVNHLEIHYNDLIINGVTGEEKSQALYSDIKESIFNHNPIFNFKEYCGEYATASSFGLAFAVDYLKRHPKNNCWLLNNFGSFWSIWYINGKHSIK